MKILFPVIHSLMQVTKVVALPVIALTNGSLVAQTDNWIHSEVTDEAAAFFDDTYVHEIRITFDADGFTGDDWYDILFDSHDSDLEDPYFIANFSADGVTIENVGVRFKGNSSFDADGYKKSFKIDFDEFAVDGEEKDFFGLAKLNLNTNYNDPSQMREKLFMDFASNFVEGIGRTVYTNVYVNDELIGLFSAVEQIDKTFVQSRFGSSEDGNLYKGAAGEDADADDPQSDFGSDLTWLGDDLTLYDARYQLKTNETAYDYTQLEEFIDVLNNIDSENLPAALEPLLDVSDTLANMALNNLFSNLDSYMGSAHNYYIYDRDDTGQFTHILWDENESFGTFTLFTDTGDDLERLDPFWLPVSTSDGPPHLATTEQEPRPLMENLWAVDEYKQDYLRDLAQMLRGGFDEASALVRINQLAALIEDHVDADPNKQFTTAQFETNLTGDVSTGRSSIFGLSSFIANKASYLNDELDDYATTSDLAINELMAANLSTVQDSAGDFDPWVEIYNIGPGEVSTNGLYLTDDVNDLDKWELPSSDLDDGEFLTIWVDGETGEGNDHASFELNAAGGTLLLTDGSNVIDTYAYEAASDDVSLARFPDGYGEWASTDIPSFGSENTEGSIQDVEIFINEVMADNETTIEDPDEAESYEDWIELYNAEDEAVDLSGMYLTDDAEDPTQWQIAEGTTIEAGGFLIIWADKDEEQGDNHASFKLSSNGETLLLYHIDGATPVDSFEFGEHQSDVSYGRYVDGSDTFHVMLTPTPGAANVEGFDLVDSVGDGITDEWRSENFGGDGTETTADSESTADPDGDGLSNYNEYLADSDPNDSTSGFSIEVAGDDTSLSVTFDSSENRYYSLWRSADLTEDSWVKMDGLSNILGTGGEYIFTDTLPLEDIGFYRMEVELP